MLERLQRVPVLARVTGHIPPAQFGRYVAIGVGNTLFGYGSYAILTAVLMPRVPHGYILAGVLSSILNITFAFLNYKWFVFRTSGNYLREWARCLMVYSGGIVLTAAFLPATVFLVRRLAGLDRSAPYVAGGMLMVLNVILSFLGHKKFSFASSPVSIAPNRPEK